MLLRPFLCSLELNALVTKGVFYSRMGYFSEFGLSSLLTDDAIQYFNELDGVFLQL